MKKINIIIITFLTAFAGYSIFAEPSALPLGTLKFTIKGKNYNFRDTAKGIVQKKGENQYRVIIGVKDPNQKVKMSIVADLEKGFELIDHNLTSDFNDLMFVIKSKESKLMLLPAVKLIKSKSVRYNVKDHKNKRRGKAEKKEPGWMRKNRAERIASGEGVIMHHRMKDNKFFLNLFPIVVDGKVTELQGSFSGLMQDSAMDKTGKKFIRIKNGEFRVQVIEPEKE